MKVPGKISFGPFWVKNTLHVVTKWRFRRFLANFFQCVDVVNTKKYFEDLISPLAKSSEIEDLQATIEKQQKEITSLKADLAAKSELIAAMQLEMTRINNNADVIYKQGDEQYHRRYCTRINGIAVADKGATDDVMAHVESCHTAIGLQFDPNEIDRAHRVGKPNKHPVTKKVTQQIIVKFKS